jgi:hypothetical protein
LLQGVDDPADVVVGVLQGARIDLHLAFQDGLDLLGHVVPGRYLVVAGGQVGVGANDAEFLLRAKVISRWASQPRANLPRYLSAHSFGT